MADPYLGGIRIMSLGLAPRGWAQRNGRMLAINQDQTPHSLSDTTYGGSRVTTCGPA